MRPGAGVLGAAEPGSGGERTVLTGSLATRAAARERAAATTRRARLGAVASVALPALVAIALTSYQLTTRSIWLDESATIAIASQSGHALWAGMAHDGGNMLVYYAVVHLLMGWFGETVLVVRLPAVIGTALTAAAVALLGRRLFGNRVGLSAGLISAVSLPLVYWGQNARAYAFLFAFVATSYVGFVALATGESRRRPGRAPLWAVPLYAGSLVLASYMSFIALLVVPAQLLALYFWRRRVRAVVFSLAGVALLVSPLAVLALQRGAGQLFWVPRPNFGTTGSVLEALTSSALTPNFTLTASSLPLLGITTLFCGCLAYRCWRWARSHRLATGHSLEYFLAATIAGWLLLPSLLDFFESLVGQSVFESRYLLISAPALALVLAWGIFRIDFPRSGLGRYGAPAMVGLFLVLRGLQILPTYGQSPENWRAATRYVLERAEPGDCIAFYPSDGRMAFDYYLRSGDGVPAAIPTPVLPRLAFSQYRPFVEIYKALTPAEVNSVAASCPRLWVVSSHVGGLNETARTAVHYDRYRNMLGLLSLSYPQQVWAHFGYASRINVGLFGSHLGSDKASLDSYLRRL